MTPEIFEKIAELKLGSSIKFDSTEVVRVPGGWIYKFMNSMHTEVQSSLFVPLP